MAYVPSTEDLESTRDAIHNQRFWGIPSIGCVLIFYHDYMFFDTFMKSDPTEEETKNFEAVEANLIALGYSERNASIIGGTKNLDDVLFAISRAINIMEIKGEADEIDLSLKKNIEELLARKGV